MKLCEIISVINKYAPESIACEWDNTGLQLGDINTQVTKALICVDVTDYVVNEAIKSGAQLIISHHPLLFHPLKNITNDRRSECIKKLIRRDISVYSSHTSFDASPYGMNAYCARKLNIKTDSFLEKSALKGYGIGVCGDIKESISVLKLAEEVKKLFASQNVKISNFDKERIVSRAALCSGAGADYINEAKALGADVLITADCKNSNYINAYEKDIALLSVTHFESEKCFIKLMKGILQREVPQIEITQSEACDFEYYV